MTAAVIVAAAGCAHGDDGAPARLLDGSPAAQFRPVAGGVLTAGRVVNRSLLGDRVDRCLAANERTDVAPDTPVVERVGIDGESLTFSNRDGTGVYACDGGIDPAGERARPWCGTVFGQREQGRLLDPRLDVICVDGAHLPLAYAFVEPVAGAHWIGVRQDGYVELYEVLGDLPVRISSARGVDAANARATFELMQYDLAGREILSARLEAAVAG